ncbi:hypothetical protein MPSEU_000742800 [Mayamaea pseudoterrestris]|nr:hypothetical protein MPSEU_000742800 [Mayamaea pseudoterrestris]
MISRQYQKADTMDDLEVAPLRSLSRSSSRSNNSMARGSQYSSVTGSADDLYNDVSSISRAKEHHQLFQHALAVTLFMLASWHVPRYMTAIETTMATKLPPYQLLDDGQVLLNQELSHPLIEPATIPTSILLLSSILMPFILILVSAWLMNLRLKFAWQRIHYVHASLCAFGTALGLSEGPTQLLKLYVQRPRPNYYALCGFEMATQRCLADVLLVREANFSFPSGHSSLSACASVFLTWYVCGLILSRSSNELSMAQKRFLCVSASTMLLSWCIFVAASRLVDHWHHHADVVAGLLLGSLAATLGYHVWYPPIWNARTGVPYSLIDIAEGLEQQKKELSIHD